MRFQKVILLNNAKTRTITKYKIDAIIKEILYSRLYPNATRVHVPNIKVTATNGTIRDRAFNTF